MRTPTRFRAETKYTESAEKKANVNPPMMAAVGNGDGATAAVVGRANFFWVRLLDDDNRLTQAFCQLALSYDDLIYVAKAKDRKLTYYEFVAFIQDTDGETEVPVCPKFAQVVYVSENSCQFATVSEAVTYINALATGPLATRLFLIKVQAGNFAETGDVTIPQYVSLEGVGEASEIEMGANTLFLDSDTSLESLVVESSDPVAAIGVIAEDNVVMRDVRCIQTAAAGTPDCFYLNANTNVYLYNCIAEVAENGVGYHVVNDDAVMYLCTAFADTYSATTYGFQVGGVASVELYYCIADDDTNFGDGLHLDAAGLTCATRWCTFAGADDDVNTGAASIWQHFMCQFDPDNSTVAGTETPLVTGQANFDDVVTFENGFTCDGLTTQNIITIPTALAVGMTLVDTNAIEYLMIDTDPQLVVHWNRGEVDVDHIISANGMTNAVFVQGSDGAITVAGPSVTVPDGWILGIGPALERLVFDAAGDISVMGANFGIGTPTPATRLEIAGTQSTIFFNVDTWAGVAAILTDDATNSMDFNNTAVGGDFRFYATEDIHFRTSVVDPAMTILKSGGVGIGTPTPLGRLHGFDTHGGFMYWEGDVDGAGEVVIIPNGAGDVERAAFFTQITWANAAADYGCTHSCIINPGDGPSISDLYADGVPNRLQLQLKANGELVLLRTQGADTYDVVMWIIWQ